MNRNDWTHHLIPAIVRRDPYLQSHTEAVRWRINDITGKARTLQGEYKKFSDFAAGHEYYGLHRNKEGWWVLREWAPNATAVFLRGEFNNWQDQGEYLLKRVGGDGTWELWLAPDRLRHGDLYRLGMHWHGGRGDRLPAWGRRVVQDNHTKIFNAQVWAPEKKYKWKHPKWRRPDAGPVIYEAHIGMAQEDGKVGTYVEFREKILPRIKKAGYNTVQLMAIQEHPYYGSFGYHVSNYFAASSRFGTPEELKELIDEAHGMGIAVIMDIVHSHAVKNEVEGISCYDGTYTQFFHAGDRGNHAAWDSRCFDYGRDKVLHFLLSNCRFWLDEYKFDGFRFDGVTSMLYIDHGLGKTFTSYGDYFGDNVDRSALVYLGLANTLLHEIRPDAITVAEDVSGMPGLAAPIDEGGVGFDYRLSMGVPDYWIKVIKELPDEKWNVSGIWHELTNKRWDEKTVNYCESHDQALVGDQTIIFRLIEEAMYWDMSIAKQNLRIDRGIALHKLIRLVTLATAGGAYLNFMGNEFGHPEWIDFPRQGNNWSYHYARRQWSLRDNPELKYRFLAEFDEAMIRIAAKYDLIRSESPWKWHEHVDDHTLSFSRAGLLFVFNFDATRSFTGYQVKAPEGRYRLLLDSDSPEFGGFERLQAGQTYTSGGGFHGDDLQHFINMSLPSRTALVLEKLKRS